MTTAEISYLLAMGFLVELYTLSVFSHFTCVDDIIS